MAKSFAFWFEQSTEPSAENNTLGENTKKTIPDITSSIDTSTQSAAGVEEPDNKSNKKNLDTDLQNESPATTGAELHINYWYLKTAKINYLDIGVKFDASHKFESIQIYLPFNADKLDYNDKLGETVCHNHQLIPAVFNATINTTEHDHSLSTYLVTFKDPKSNPPIKFFTNILPASTQSAGGVRIEPEVEGVDDGTIIKFPRDILQFSQEEIDNHNKISGYFRFRIILNSDDVSRLSRVYKPKGSQITNQFESSEMIDFRINESRILPLKIRRKISDYAFIKKVHFFLIRDVNSEYKMSHSAYSRCRILEENIWDKYLGSKNPIGNQMLIYHWKSKTDDETPHIDHFSAFAKFTTRTFPFRDVSLGVILFIFLGISSSYGSSCLWRYFNEDPQSVENSTEQSHLVENQATTRTIDSTYSSIPENPVDLEPKRGK